jgi:hypothetical protein
LRINGGFRVSVLDQLREEPMADTDEMLRPAMRQATPTLGALLRHRAFRGLSDDASGYTAQIMSGLRSSTWIAIAVAIVLLVAVLVVVGSFWIDLGDSGMTASGYIAMALGVLATLALGMGLMALVFISNRRGYDDPGEPLP